MSKPDPTFESLKKEPQAAQLLGDPPLSKRCFPPQRPKS